MVIPKSLHHIVRQRARFQCEYCHYPELLSDALTLFLHWRKSCYIMGCGSSLLGMIRSGGINRSNVFLCKGFILYNPLHCITQTEEPKLLKAELFLDRLEEITDQASDGIQKAKL